VRSAQAVQSGRQPVIAQSDLENKICLIGLTVPDLGSFVVTPFEANYPSVGVLANVINTYITGHRIYEVSLPLQMLLLIVAGFLAIRIFNYHQKVISLLLSLGLALLWLGSSYLLFWEWGYWIYIFPLVPFSNAIFENGIGK